jgi:hypothetical protein
MLLFRTIERKPDIYISTNSAKMVRVISDTSCNSPTASSCDRYKYRYGCNSHSRNMSKNEREETVYKRPASASTMKGVVVSKKEKDRVVRGGGEGGERGEVIQNLDGCMNYYIDVIADKFNKANNICDTIDTIIAMRPKVLWATKKRDDGDDGEGGDMKIEKEEQREKEEREKEEREKEEREKEEREKEEREKEEREKEEREKEEREKEEREKEEERKMMMINTKLGQIIYHSKSGEKFTAFHSIHSHTELHFDKKMRQITRITTQKIVWNYKIYNSKEIWFREMAIASLSADPPIDEKMKLVRCSKSFNLEGEEMRGGGNK